MRRVALTAAITLALAACGAPAGTSDVEGAWQLVSGAVAGKAIPIVDSHPITMTLEGDSIGGTAACNSYGGSFSHGPSSVFSVGSIAMTEMACMPVEVMDAERMFMTALTGADRIEMEDDGTLSLEGPGVELSFALLPPVPTADLVGTVWVLDGLISDGTVTSVMGDVATLQLQPDGTFAGGTGCRTIFGRYLITGAEVQFTSFEAEGECPPDLAAQDSNVISALEGGFRVEIAGGRLTTWAAGDEGLTYVAED